MTAGALAVAVSCFSAPAYAHRPLVKRVLSLEPGKDGQLHCLIHLALPAPQRRAHLLAVDRNRDGTLDAKERADLTELLADRAIDGVSVFVGSSSIAWSHGTAQLDAGAAADEPAQLMLYATAPLPASVHRVEVRTRRLSDPLDLLVLPGNRPVKEASRGAPGPRGLSVSLRSEDRVWLELTAPREAR